MKIFQWLWVLVIFICFLFWFGWVLLSFFLGGWSIFDAYLCFGLLSLRTFVFIYLFILLILLSEWLIYFVLSLWNVWFPSVNLNKIISYFFVNSVNFLLSLIWILHHEGCCGGGGRGCYDFIYLFISVCFGCQIIKGLEWLC